MKTFTVEEFKKYLEITEFEASQYTEVDTVTSVPASNFVGDEQPEVESTQGWASKTATKDGLTFEYYESFNYETYQPEETFEYYENEDDGWKFHGFKVVDEDGDELEHYEVVDLLEDSQLEEALTDIDYSYLKPETENVDEKSEDNEVSEGYEEVLVEVTNDKDLKFVGKLVGSASTKTYQSTSWSTYVLYQTKGGKYVGQKSYYSLWAGSQDCHEGEVLLNEDAIFSFFGADDEAKELYEEAGLEFVTLVN